MSIAQSLEYLFGGRSLSAIQEDIRSEFAFHIEAATDELVSKGWSPEEAKQEAERKFGNRETIQMKCQSIQTGRLLWLTRIGIVGGVLSLLTISCLSYFLMNLVQQNRVLLDKLESAKGMRNKVLSPTIESSTTAISVVGEGLTAETVPNGSQPSGAVLLVEQAQKETLKGKVNNSEGKPIPNAKVVLIHKSWPNNKFQMGNDVTETDKEGNYHFKDLYSTSGDNEFLVTIFAQGNEMRSEYISIKAKKKVGPVDFRLKPAKSIVFQVLGPDKEPLAETNVVLLSRKAGTKEHVMYPASLDDAKWQTDDQGRVTISFLNEGDTAKFGVLIFGEIQAVEVKISADASQVIELQKKR